VHVDGLITLGDKPITVTPLKHTKFLFPPEAKVIAPYYGPTDVTNTSRVSYRETRDPYILSRAGRDVRQSFAGEQDFNATVVFIATWYQVKHAQHRQHKKVRIPLSTFLVEKFFLKGGFSKMTRE
jgi:hypothetical protein